jgi:hypothetical protein
VGTGTPADVPLSRGTAGNGPEEGVYLNWGNFLGRPPIPRGDMILRPPIKPGDVDRLFSDDTDILRRFYSLFASNPLKCQPQRAPWPPNKRRQPRERAAKRAAAPRGLEPKTPGIISRTDPLRGGLFLGGGRV